MNTLICSSRTKNTTDRLCKSICCEQRLALKYTWPRNIGCVEHGWILISQIDMKMKVGLNFICVWIVKLIGFE